MSMDTDRIYVGLRTHQENRDAHKMQELLAQGSLWMRNKGINRVWYVDGEIKCRTYKIASGREGIRDKKVNSWIAQDIYYGKLH